MGSIDNDHVIERQSEGIPPPSIPSDCIHRLFEKQARIRPDQDAIISWDGVLTYAELDALSSRLAIRLIELRVGPEIIVPFCFEKSSWTIVAMLATLKAGGACVALDPSYPEARLREIVQQAGSGIILAGEKQASLCEGLPAKTLVIGPVFFRDFLPKPRMDIPPRASPDNVAFVIFTSGSTGKPKGVMQLHSGICAANQGLGSAMGLNPSSRVLQFSSYTWDICLQDIFFTLMHGGCVCVPSESERLDDLAGAIDRMKVNTANLTPSVAELLLPESVPTLKNIMILGEAPSSRLISTWSTAANLHQSYGPTECTVLCTWKFNLPADADPADVGCGIAGTTLHIVAERDHNILVPDGTVGEVLIEGPLLARGYLHDEAKTNMAYIENPTWTQDEESSSRLRITRRRFYKTGDLGTLDANGSLHVFGRKDSQVKINGQRVELREIDSHLRAHHLIRQSVPIVPKIGDQKGRLIVVASLTTTSTTHQRVLNPLGLQERTAAMRDVSSIVADLSAILPPYMVPRQWVVLEALPLSITGKLDRLSVTHWLDGHGTEVMGVDSVLPSNDLDACDQNDWNLVESALQQIWSEILDQPLAQITRHTTFFALGGDSISAMRIVSKSRQMKLSLSVNDVLRYPTIAQLARNVSECKEQEVTIELTDEAPLPTTQELDKLDSRVLPELGLKGLADVEEIYPATAMQNALLISQAKTPGTYALRYTWSLYPSFDSSLDIIRLQDAWNKVIARHTILRTILLDGVGKSGLPYQLVLKNPVRNDWNLVERAATPPPSSVAFEAGKPEHRLFIETAQNGALTCTLFISHAIFDGTSAHVMLQHLAAAYKGELPAEVPMRYSEYARYVGAEAIQPSVDFWRTRLANVTICHMPSITDEQGATKQLRTADVPIKSSLGAIESFCKQHSLTVSNIFHGVWALMLRQFTGSDSVCFGTIVSDREAPIQGIDETVGVFINTMTCYVQLNPAHSAIDTLKNMQEDFARDLPYANCPLAEIHHALEINSEERLFNTGISFERQTSNWPLDAPFTVREIDIQDPTEYDLTLNVTVKENVLKAHLSFWTSHISEAQARNIACSLGHVIDSVQTKGYQRIADLSFVCDKNLDDMYSWNKNLPVASPECYHSILERVMQRWPNRMAVSSWDGDLTYGDLDKYSGRLACQLQNVGAVPESFVPFCFEKSKWAIVTMIGILRAGAAFVPMDPANPPDRLATIAEEVNATVMVTSEKNYRKCHGLVDTIFIASETLLREVVYPVKPVLTLATPQNAMYAIFTSGSTGRPKGLVVTHSAYCTGLENHSDVCRYHLNVRTLQFASYSFDSSIGEICPTLSRGGCMCIPSDLDIRTDMAGYIRRERLNFVGVTPSFAALLDPGSLPSIETLVLAGEPLNNSLVSTWADNVSLVNMYGPTECSVACVANTKVTTATDSSNIGKGYRACCWVVQADDPDHLVPVGVVGELLIEGPILARGYLNDSEKTAAAFISPPPWLQKMGPGRGPKLYRTGDLALFNSDGTLRLVGRKDMQIKLRGLRIEIGEVEHHLKQCLQVSGLIFAVDIATLKGRAGSPMLLAFICVSKDREDYKSEDIIDASPCAKARLASLTAGIRSRMSQSIPSYMIPSAFVPLRRMPYAISNKADRRKLRSLISELEPDQFAELTTSGEKVFSAPSTKLEQQLCELWSGILGISSDRVSANSSFFQLGGDSITAIKLVAEARSGGLGLTVKDIFNWPTLCDMAGAIENQKESNTDVAIEKFAMVDNELIMHGVLQEAADRCNTTTEEIEDIYPPTPLQEGLMALSLRNSGASYIGTWKFRLHSTVDVQRLRQAWQTIIQQSPILRTSLVTTSQGLFQVVRSHPSIWQSSNNWEEFVDRRKDMAIPNSLFRLAFINHSDGQVVLAVMAHHAIYDGWSLSLIFNAVEEYYKTSASVPLAPFNKFIHHLIKSPTEDARNYWIRQLAGASTTAFPTLPSPDHKIRADTVIEHFFNLPEQRDTSVTLPHLVRAAWSFILSRYCQSPDVTFGMTLSGRTASVAEIENIIGPTIATVPIRVIVSPEQRVSEWLQTIQRNAADMLPFEQIGLQKLRDFGSDAQEACKFQTFLIIQNSDGSGKEEFGGILSTPDATDRVVDFHAYAVNLECSLTLAGMGVRCEFDPRVVADSQMRRILAQFAYVLEQIMTSSESMLISELQMTTAEDFEDIGRWNGAIFQSVDVCLHQLVRQRGMESPDSKAICSWDGSFTFQELDTQAEVLAARLITAGIRPSSMIPVCLEKSKWAIVALLGILKAGCAFVPLDPSLPLARLEFIVNEIDAQYAIATPLHHTLLAGLVKTVISATNTNKPEIVEASANNVLTGWRPSSDDPAYVIFTSGSSGTPKGVVIQHKTASTGCLNQGKAYGYCSETRTLQFAAYAFDASILEIFATLIHGGSVCVPADDDRLYQLAKVINYMNVNSVCLTPAVASALKPDDVPGLKTMTIGGEKIRRENIEIWGTRVSLFNVYGPTECCVTCVAQKVEPGLYIPDTIGRAVNGTTWIVDADDTSRIVPVGVEGELVIEGPLAKGYLNDEERTTEAFAEGVPWLTRFGRDPGSRIYRTGDVVRYNPDGSIKFLGRKDRQIKLRGLRIELGDIEYHLRRRLSELLRQGGDLAVEVVTLAGGQSAVILAFIALPDSAIRFERGDSRIPESAKELLRKLVTGIEAKLLKDLPAYMLPSAYLPLQRLPGTTSEKVDRRALKELGAQYRLDDLIQDAPAQQGRAPSSEKEKLMQACWGQVLDVDPASLFTNADFFRVGGDSIKVMQLISKCRISGLSLNAVTVFDTPTLAEMAAAATRLNPDAETVIGPFSLISNIGAVDKIMEMAATQCGVSPSLITDIYPCTPSQAEFMKTSDAFPGVYLLQNVFLLPEDLSLDQFKSAWSHVVKEHEILRSRMVQSRTTGILQAVIRQDIGWREAVSLQDYLRDDLASPMLWGDELSRFAIIHESSSGHLGSRYFVWTTHHSIYDGVTLVHSLQAFREVHDGRGFESPPPFNQFISWLETRDHVACSNFWAEYFEGAKSTNFPALPCDSYKPRTTNTEKLSLDIAHDADSGTTISMLLRGAWAILLANYASTDDVVFNATVSGRNAPVPNVSKVVGPTMSNVPVRLQIRSEETSGDFLRRIQTEGAKTIPYEHLDLQKVSGHLPAIQDACGARTLLVIQSANLRNDMSNQNLPLGMKKVPVDCEYFHNCAVVLECFLRNHGADVEVHFDNDLISTIDAQILLGRFQIVVQELTTLPANTTLRDLREHIQSAEYREKLTDSTARP